MRRMTLAGLVLGLGTGVGEAALTRPEPPSASDDVITVSEDTNSRVSKPGVLKNDQLRSMGPLRAVLVSTTAHGKLTLHPDGSLAYQPDADFNGVDLFTYAATDGSRVSDPAIVAITVMPVNDPPVAGDDHVTLTGPGSIKLYLTANDTDVDGVVVPNSLTIMTPPRQGEVRVGPSGSVTYTPAPGSSGRDAFSYIVWDDRGARSNAAAVFLERP